MMKRQRHDDDNAAMVRITAVRIQGRRYRVPFSGDPLIIAEEDITGTTPEALEKAMAFVKKNTDMMLYVGPDGVRKDRPEYPEEAVREALNVSTAYRDSREPVHDRHIEIRLFYDRMEIVSRGRAGNMQNGMETMTRALFENDMPAPEFRELDDSFMVTFRKKLFRER